MSDDVNSKYTYHTLEFINLTTYPFQESYLIPGLIDNLNEQITISLLSEVDSVTEQKYLATILGISRSGVTVLTTEMIQKGLIQQIPNPDDRRGFLLSLTDLGKKVAGWLIYRRQVFNKYQMKGFTKDEIRTFNEMATRIAQNVLDLSDREIRHMPAFNEGDWKIDDKPLSILSDEDREVFVSMTKRVKKINGHAKKA